jgi:hypothetical protein
MYLGAETLFSPGGSSLGLATSTHAWALSVTAVNALT